MIKVFLSYSREDGLEAAARLRSELERAGFFAWRDIEEMRGGEAWKAQVCSQLREVDAALLLLSPESVESHNVTWEWETALTLQKKVIGLLIVPCDPSWKPPPELSSLHYHRLDKPEYYPLGFAALIRDLNELPRKSESPPPETGSAGSTFNVYDATKSAIGNNPTVINQAPLSPRPRPK